MNGGANFQIFLLEIFRLELHLNAQSIFTNRLHLYYSLMDWYHRTTRSSNESNDYLDFCQLPASLRIVSLSPTSQPSLSSRSESMNDESMKTSITWSVCLPFLFLSVSLHEITGSCLTRRFPVLLWRQWQRVRPRILIKKRLLQERVFERRQNKVALVDRPIEAGIMQVHRRISRGEPLKTRASTACGSRYFTLVAFHAGPVPGYCLTVSRENARREIASVKRATRRFHICVPSAISCSPFALSFFLSFSLFFSLTWFFSFYFV